MENRLGQERSGLLHQSLVFYTDTKLKSIVIREAARQNISISTLLRMELHRTISQNDWAK